MEHDNDLVFDLEECCKKSTKIPKGKHYKLRIDKEKYVVRFSEITGKQLLELAHKTPPDRYALYQKVKGGQTTKIEPTTIVDLTTPGIERFMTIPLDSTEGC